MFDMDECWLTQAEGSERACCVYFTEKFCRRRYFETRQSRRYGLLLMIELSKLDHNVLVRRLIVPALGRSQEQGCCKEGSHIRA